MNGPSRHGLRSLLFAPGNHPRKLAKVDTFGADGIVLDLEDSVADPEKDAARSMVRDALATLETETIVCVRVNAYETGRLEGDLDAVVMPGLGAIMIPKVEDPSTLALIGRLVSQMEIERGIETESIRLLALVETARGLVRCEEMALAAPERLETLIFGSSDLSADVGIDVSSGSTELLYARTRIAVAARAGRLAAPIDGPFLGLNDAEGLAADTERSRRLGYQGRVVIYPPHVEIAQRIYSTLTEAECAHLRRVIEAFEASEQAGSASIQVDGQFVDYAIYRDALSRLGRFETTSSIGTGA
jgi:citrate lyase subunit beta / citryl-CoA lyase